MLRVSIKNRTRAYLMINCETESEAQVLSDIRSLPQVCEAMLTVGKHDILTLIEAYSFEELRDILVHRIRKIPGVRCTTTLVCIGAQDAS